MTAVKIEVGQVWRHKGINDMPDLGDWQVTRITTDGMAFVNHLKNSSGEPLRGEVGFCFVDLHGNANSVEADEWTLLRTEMVHKTVVHINGLNCKKCREHFPMAESNQSDGTLVCWSCKNYPFYKGRL